MEGERVLAVQRNPGQRAMPLSGLTAFSLVLGVTGSCLTGILWSSQDFSA